MGSSESKSEEMLENEMEVFNSKVLTDYQSELFDYLYDHLSLFNAFVTTHKRNNLYPVNSITETIIDGKRHFLLLRVELDKFNVTYFDENFNCLKQEQQVIKCPEHVDLIIYGENEYLIYNYQLQLQLLKLKPYSCESLFLGTINSFKVEKDQSITAITITKSMDNLTEFTWMRYHKKTSGLQISNNCVVPFKAQMYENLLFYYELDVGLLEYYESHDRIIFDVKKMDGMTYIIYRYGLISIDCWKDGVVSTKFIKGLFELNDFFNERNICYQGSSYAIASIVSTGRDEWKEKAVEILKRIKCLDKLASSLLRIVVDYV